MHYHVSLRFPKLYCGFNCIVYIYHIRYAVEVLSGHSLTIPNDTSPVDSGIIHSSNRNYINAYPAIEDSESIILIKSHF